LLAAAAAMLAATAFQTNLATAQTARETAALNNLQHEMSRCIAYQMIVAECVTARDPNLAAEYDKVAKHLFEFAFRVGSTIGMTEDAMTSRVVIERIEMQNLIQNDCVNISSLYSRHALRCKEVVEDGDSVLLEYLEQQ
jgi:hypothetical protein